MAPELRGETGPCSQACRSASCGCFATLARVSPPIKAGERVRADGVFSMVRRSWPVSDGQRWRVVALLAREPGLAVLREGLLADAGVELAALYTHRRRPRSEDPLRSERPEYQPYADLACAAGVPLHAVDTRAEALELEGLEAYRPFDVLLSLSWRYRVSPAVLSWPRIAAINLHRGRLPTYAGAEPVRRALEAGETSITLTAHRMIEEIDAGPVLVECVHPVSALRGPTLADDVERIKRELWPLYPLVAMEAMARANESRCLRPAMLGSAGASPSLRGRGTNGWSRGGAGAVR